LPFSCRHFCLPRFHANRFILQNSRLFTHFFAAFGFIFGCTLVQDFPKTNESGGPISLAYVHKFMNLNQTDLGHFIDQLTTSSKYFGFSDTDAETLSTYMNAKYNVRCAPPVNGQLNSLCQAPECPLAAPSPDCAAYANLGPSGIGNGTGPAQTQAPSAPTSPTTSTTSTTLTSTSSISPTAISDSSKLSSGAIAGIVIGSAAVVLIAVGLLLFFLRRPATPQIIPVSYPVGGYSSPSHPSYGTNPHNSFSPLGPHDSFMGQGVGPGYYAPKPPEGAELHPGQGDGRYNVGLWESSPPQVAPMTQIAEMESPHGLPQRNSIPPMESVDASNM
jgi:hypothetical protein